MKPLSLFVLLLVGVLACNPSNRDASPSDPLYRTWKLTELKGTSGNWASVSSSWEMEFFADGRIQYHMQHAPCCMPVQVKRQQETLTVEQYYSGAGCETIDCAPATSFRIVSLTNDELILESISSFSQPLTQTFLKYEIVR